MLRTTLASSRALRVCVLGLATLTTAILITSDSAEARRYRHRHYVRHHVSQARESYSPQFSSIIVDGNSGAVLASNNPDGSRHPASLTKIMTLYLLFERLESGKMKLDSEMDVSEHASEQAPTKLGLRPGQTIKVEDAIKGLVTRSANDAAVVIAEAIGGEESDFAKMMTRKARALGMSRTVYRNASGLPDDDQVTTARDQATLGRAIQERFPRYYRFFSTTVFNYHGQSIRNLLAENLAKAATTHTVAAITDHYPSGANAEVAEAEAASRPNETVQVNASVAAAEPALATPQPARPAAKASLMAAAAAALPPSPAKVEQPAKSEAKPESRSEPKSDPAPLTNGVIQTQPISAIPGSAEPMKPVRVRTVQIKAGQIKLASAGPSQPAPPVTNAIPARPEPAETPSALVATAEAPKPEIAKTEIARTEIART